MKVHEDVFVLTCCKGVAFTLVQLTVLCPDGKRVCVVSRPNQQWHQQEVSLWQDLWGHLLHVPRQGLPRGAQRKVSGFVCVRVSRCCDGNRGTDSNMCHERRSKNSSMNIKSTWFQVDLLSRDFKKSCFGALVRWDEAMTLKCVLTAGDLTGVWNSKSSSCWDCCMLCHWRRWIQSLLRWTQAWCCPGGC